MHIPALGWELGSRVVCWNFPGGKTVFLGLLVENPESRSRPLSVTIGDPESSQRCVRGSCTCFGRFPGAYIPSTLGPCPFPAGPPQPPTSQNCLLRMWKAGAETRGAASSCAILCLVPGPREFMAP